MTTQADTWQLFCGLAVIAVSAYWYRKGEVPVGIDDDRPPTFHLRGRTAKVFAAVWIAIGIGVAAVAINDLF